MARSRLFPALASLLIAIVLLQECAAYGKPKCPTKLNFAIGSYSKSRWFPTFGVGVTFATLTLHGIRTTGVAPRAQVGHNPAYCALGRKRKLYCCTGGESAMTQLNFRRRRAPRITRAVQPGPQANHMAVMPWAAHGGGDIAFVADYSGKLLSFVTKGKDPRKWSYHEFVVPLELATNTTWRQRNPHPHQTLPLGGDEVLLVDLGADAVLRLAIGRNGEIEWRDYLKFEPMDGPRHAAQHPQLKDTVYVLNEFSLTVVRLRRGTCNGETRVQTGPFLKCQRRQFLDVEAEGASAAAIRVSADGRFLYASVRYKGKKTPGSIVGFAIEKDGSIGRRVGIWSSQGLRPRDFSIIERFGDKNGNCLSFLAIVNRDSDHLVFVPRDVQTGVVGNSVRFRLSVKTPTSVLTI